MAMPKQNKASSKKKKIDNTVGRMIKTHKNLSVVVLLVLLSLPIIAVLKYINYLDKFSDKDFAAISAQAKTVFRNVGADKIYSNKHCSYEAPREFSKNRLYCQVEVAAYLPYISDARAVEVAKALERESDKLGESHSDLADFYSKPKNSLSGLTVAIAPPLRANQCLFTIATNEKAQRVISFLPERTEDNLIALRFNCSAESRREYFPVTYRQGQ
jgi:hypothetical protein